ncbi:MULTISPECIES: NPCBM/NEW2 domain-containing protein [unclassified Nocardia]|uniref:NPCBM/NEW2 domain-containing protein n=1 Tax=unclassified Nocardia TaxID=2637762 RepID=UPI0024A94F50|nr:MULTISPECIES: NPCBM/NEW2 domain-containing protein [unclassified Nocardia]
MPDPEDHDDPDERRRAESAATQHISITTSNGSVNFSHGSTGANQSASNGAHDPKSPRRGRWTLIGTWVAAVATVVGVVVAVVLAAPWKPEPEAGIPHSTAPVPSAEPITPTAAVTTTRASVTSTTPAGERWYNLVEYRSVVWNNGFDTVDPVQIGTESFPGSIVGYYPSSLSDAMNKAIWVLGGNCSKLSVWIGKDAASPYSAGAGRFVVRGDDADLFTGEKGMSDPAEEVSVDLTGVVRLTLLDTRRSQDAKNAWGTPRVYCSAPPGKKR